MVHFLGFEFGKIVFAFTCYVLKFYFYFAMLCFEILLLLLLCHGRYVIFSN